MIGKDCVYKVILTWTTTCIGCGGDNAVPKGQETPQQTVRKGWNAVRTNDFTAIKEVYDAEGLPADLLLQVCEAGHKAWTCRMKVTKRFGAEGWRLFSEPSPSDERNIGEFELSVSAAQLDDDWIDSTEFLIDGDSATFVDPASELEVHLTRKDGVWKIEFPEGNHTLMKKWFASMSVAMDAALAHVNNENMTPKKLKKIASEAFVQSQQDN